MEKKSNAILLRVTLSAIRRVKGRADAADAAHTIGRRGFAAPATKLANERMDTLTAQNTCMSQPSRPCARVALATQTTRPRTARSAAVTRSFCASVTAFSIG